MSYNQYIQSAEEVIDTVEELLDKLDTYKATLDGSNLTTDFDPIQEATDFLTETDKGVMALVGLQASTMAGWISRYANSYPRHVVRFTSMVDERSVQPYSLLQGGSEGAPFIISVDTRQSSGHLTIDLDDLGVDAQDMPASGLHLMIEDRHQSFRYNPLSIHFGNGDDNGNPVGLYDLYPEAEDPRVGTKVLSGRNSYYFFSLYQKDFIGVLDPAVSPVVVFDALTLDSDNVPFKTMGSVNYLNDNAFQVTMPDGSISTYGKGTAGSDEVIVPEGEAEDYLVLVSQAEEVSHPTYRFHANEDEAIVIGHFVNGQYGILSAGPEPLDAVVTGKTPTTNVSIRDMYATMDCRVSHPYAEGPNFYTFGIFPEVFSDQAFVRFVISEHANRYVLPYDLSRALDEVKVDSFHELGSHQDYDTAPVMEHSVLTNPGNTGWFSDFSASLRNFADEILGVKHLGMAWLDDYYFSMGDVWYKPQVKSLIAMRLNQNGQTNSIPQNRIVLTALVYLFKNWLRQDGEYRGPAFGYDEWGTVYYSSVVNWDNDRVDRIEVSPGEEEYTFVFDNHPEPVFVDTCPVQRFTDDPDNSVFYRTGNEDNLAFLGKNASPLYNYVHGVPGSDAIWLIGAMSKARRQVALRYMTNSPGTFAYNPDNMPVDEELVDVPGTAPVSGFGFSGQNTRLHETKYETNWDHQATMYVFTQGGDSYYSFPPSFSSADGVFSTPDVLPSAMQPMHASPPVGSHVEVERGPDGLCAIAYDQSNVYAAYPGGYFYYGFGANDKIVDVYAPWGDTTNAVIVAVSTGKWPDKYAHDGVTPQPLADKLYRLEWTNTITQSDIVGDDGQEAMHLATVEDMKSAVVGFSDEVGDVRGYDIKPGGYVHPIGMLYGLFDPNTDRLTMVTTRLNAAVEHNTTQSSYIVKAVNPRPPKGFNVFSQTTEAQDALAQDAIDDAGGALDDSMDDISN